jgi:phosphoglycolate phosphatase
MLIVFDVDGTLVDSQHDILSAMRAAFDTCGLAMPDRAAVLGIVGLSLPQAMWRLCPEADSATRAALVEAYKASFANGRVRRARQTADMLYPGVAEAVATLAARDDVLLGVATGKSRRGLAHLIDGLEWGAHFVTLQCADDHPSKPHPAMLQTAMAEAGCDPDQTVMVGDTSYDMEMACAAGVGAIGVTWGYHPAAALASAGAETVLTHCADLLPHLQTTGRLA